jgi:hypothetical protein
MSRIVKRKTFKFKFYWKCSNWPSLCSMYNWTLRATSRQILVHKSGVKIVRKTSLTYSFEKIPKLNVARLNKFGFSKVPSCDTLCKSCYHISGRTFIFKNRENCVWKNQFFEFLVIFYGNIGYSLNLSSKLSLKSRLWTHHSSVAE